MSVHIRGCGRSCAEPAARCRSPATYLFHMEVINLLVAFCSTQLYTAHATAYPGAHPFTEVLMKPPFNGCVSPPLK